jgi:signal transduction histidine kinase
MRLGIAHRIGIIVSGIMLFALGMMALISMREIHGRYSNLLLDTGRIAAVELRSKLDKLLSFGLHLDDLPGFNQQCDETIERHKGLRHALVIDKFGQVLHYDQNLLKNTLLPAPSTELNFDVSRLETEFRFLKSSIELKGQQIGQVVIAVDTQFVTEEVSSLARRLIVVAVITVSISLLLLIWFLHNHLGRPAALLLAHIRSMRSDGMKILPDSLPFRTDEIGSIAQAFNQLITDLSAAQAALQASNLELQNNAAQLQRAHEQLANKQNQLEALNRSLQQRVHEIVDELRQKDQVLINQGRQAAMGEMIGNIAHQWRQPLNVLAMLITNVHHAQQHNEMTDLYMNQSAATAHRLIQKMSTTINDFRDFFKPDKEMGAFSAANQIKLAIDMVEAGYKYNNIIIVISTDHDCILWGFANEYSQMLLNLLSNAKDSIVESGRQSGHITFTLREEGNMGVLTIHDNGGGIPETILPKIFEPYFSTKEMGTGIGLYMSKMIIERNMNGRIEVKNVAGGCVFTVAVPCAKSAD